MDLTIVAPKPMIAVLRMLCDYNTVIPLARYMVRTTICLQHTFATMTKSTHIHSRPQHWIKEERNKIPRLINTTSSGAYPPSIYYARKHRPKRSSHANALHSTRGSHRRPHWQTPTPYHTPDITPSQHYSNPKKLTLATIGITKDPATANSRRPAMQPFPKEQHKWEHEDSGRASIMASVK